MLTDAAFDAMEGSGVDDLTAAEVLSACFTMTQKAVLEMVRVENEKDRLHNIDQITTAIGNLYQLVPKGVTH